MHELHFFLMRYSNLKYLAYLQFLHISMERKEQMKRIITSSHIQSNKEKQSINKDMLPTFFEKENTTVGIRPSLSKNFTNEVQF